MPNFHPQTPSKCPPKDAIPPDGIYYRIVFNDPPTAADFIIWVLERKNVHRLDEKSKQKDCPAFAISVFLTEQGALRTANLFQRAISRNSSRGFLGLAQIKLDKHTGIFKQTGNNPDHHDLWPYIDCKLECNVVSVKGI
jgi:hypothetical protein